MADLVGVELEHLERSLTGERVVGHAHDVVVAQVHLQQFGQKSGKKIQKLFNFSLPHNFDSKTFEPMKPELIVYTCAQSYITSMDGRRCIFSYCTHKSWVDILTILNLINVLVSYLISIL